MRGFIWIKIGITIALIAFALTQESFRKVIANIFF
jgi:hypothetical protein